MDSPREALLMLTENVWSSVLMLPFAESEPPGGDTPLMVGRIRFAGAWVGHLDVRCTPGTAWQVAAAMLMLEPSELAETDVRDALGELANIVGGNLKAIMPQPTHISLPTVSDGLGADVGAACSLSLACGAESVEFVLHRDEREAS